MDKEGELITPREMAERLKVPLSWLYRRTQMSGPGAIPRVRVGKYIRFNPGAVMEWVSRTYREGNRKK